MWNSKPAQTRHVEKQTIHLSRLSNACSVNLHVNLYSQRCSGKKRKSVEMVKMPSKVKNDKRVLLHK